MREIVAAVGGSTGFVALVSAAIDAPDISESVLVALIGVLLLTLNSRQHKQGQ